MVSPQRIQSTSLFFFFAITLSACGGAGSAGDLPFGEGLPGDQGLQITVWNGTTSGNLFAKSVAQIGDFNNGGRPDLLFGDPTAASGAGTATVFAGYGGAILWSATGTSANAAMGFSVAQIGDLDQDGRLDFAISSPGASSGSGTIEIVSGTGASIRIVVGSGGYFGWQVAAAGDIDGDLTPDLWVVAKSQSKVFGISGSSFQVIRTLAGAAGSEFGNSIAGNCQFDTDGVPDVVVGAPGTVVNNLDAGAVQVYSGATGALLKQYLAGGPGQVTYPFGISGLKYGTSVACMDTDQDGYDDVLVGVPFGENNQAGFGNRGLGYLYLGGNAPPSTPTYTFMGVAGGDNLGASVASAGDVDGDGYEDMILGAPFHNPTPGTQKGSVRIYSGRTGALIGSKIGSTVGDMFGSAVFGLGDLNGDGRSEVGAFSIFNAAGVDAGQMEVFSF